MASLTAIFGKGPGKADDTEKLLNLYWNRAELKKGFAELRNELYRLQERIKREEGAKLRLQQKLEHLESMLLDPEWVHNVVMHYQLRALDLRCAGRVTRFAEQLKQQREKKQHSQRLAAWNERRKQEAAAIDRQIGELRLKVQMLEDRLQAERHRLATMNGLLRFFRRRSIMRLLERLAAALESTEQDEALLLERYDEIRFREPPSTEGLSVRTKRSINSLILAFAQQLYLHFSRDDDLAGMARDSSQKSVGAINFGSQIDCDELLCMIRTRSDALEHPDGLADILQRCSNLIADRAEYASDEEAIPISSSVTTLFDVDSAGDVTERKVDLLGENYWNLADALSR